MGSTGLSLADLPNIFIMFAALVALFIMLVILLRNMEVIGIVGDGTSEEWNQNLRPPRLLMQKVQVPFSFKLCDDEHAPHYDEVTCIISSKVRYWRAYWWGAPVRDVHSRLCGPFKDLLASMSFTRYEPHEKEVVQFSCQVLPQLGATPRAVYPLVVILARDLQDNEELRPDDMVAIVTVIHIKDEQCTLPSGVLSQYLKQANGHLSCLKQLYVTGESAEGGEGGGGYADNSELCCVCATQPLSRALLPCRHACLCHTCLHKLTKCPICRSPIHSYFCIRNEDEPLNKQPGFPLNRRLFNLFHYH